jgi:hypothetical protein
MIPLNTTRRVERYGGALIREVLASGLDLFDWQAANAAVLRTRIPRTLAGDL